MTQFIDWDSFCSTLSSYGTGELGGLQTSTVGRKAYQGSVRSSGFSHCVAPSIYTQAFPGLT